jgi:hypothetical protein
VTDRWVIPWECLSHFYYASRYALLWYSIVLDSQEGRHPTLLTQAFTMFCPSTAVSGHRIVSALSAPMHPSVILRALALQVFQDDRRESRMV